MAGVAAGKEARFQLNPPELGQLSIEMSNDDAGLRVEIMTGSDAARNELERHMPRLIERLREELANSENRAREDLQEMAQQFADSQARSSSERLGNQPSGGASAVEVGDLEPELNPRPQGDGRISLFA
nr:flagellar hook-length control protein FliK [Pacificimonas pallii]